MTIQEVYIARKETEDIFVIIGVKVPSENISGSLKEYEYLIREEILGAVSNNTLDDIITKVNVGMSTKYKITDIPRRDIVAKVTRFIERGNIIRTNLGRHILGSTFFEESKGAYTTASGVLQTSRVITNLTYARSGTVLTVTYPDHGLTEGNYINIDNQGDLGFTLEKFFLEATPTTDELSLEVYDSGHSSGNNLSLRVPIGEVTSINKINNVGGVVVSGLSEYTIKTGIVPKNDIPNPIQADFTFSNNETKITGPAIGNGKYFIRPIKSEPIDNTPLTLLTGVYEISNNVISNNVIVNARHIERNKKKHGGTLEYNPVTIIKASTGTVFDEDTRRLTVKTLTFHNILGEEILFSNIIVGDLSNPSQGFEVEVVSDTEFTVILPVGSVLPNKLSDIEFYRIRSQSVPQTIERYKIGEKIKYVTLREIPNLSWDPTSRIELIQPDLETQDEFQIDSSPLIPTTQENFNVFRQNKVNKQPVLEHQIINSEIEVFGSYDRAIDAVRLLIDTLTSARDGVYRTYHPNGNLATNATYSAFRNLSVLNGPYEEYFDDGELRVSYNIVPLHPFNTMVPVTVTGNRLLIELDNHNLSVGDLLVLNNSMYNVQECPTNNQFYVLPELYRKREDFTVERNDTFPFIPNSEVVTFENFEGIEEAAFRPIPLIIAILTSLGSRMLGNTLSVAVVPLRFKASKSVREGGYFREPVIRRFIFIRQRFSLTVFLPNHGLLEGDVVTITNSNVMKFDQQRRTVIRTTPNTFNLFVTNSGLVAGMSLALTLPSNVRKIEKIDNEGFITESRVIERDVANAIFSNSVIDGSYTEFHPTQAFKIRCNFSMGKLQGQLIQWDEEGNREYVAEYDQGDLKNKEVLNYTFTY